MFNEIQMLAATILQCARQADGEGARLSDIVNATAEYMGTEPNGKVPRYTRGGFFGEALIKLTDANLIELFIDGVHQRFQYSQSHPDERTKDNKASSWWRGRRALLKQPVLVTPWTLEAGYALAHRLRGNEKRSFVKLSKAFFAIQEILGFSLTEMSSRRQSSVLVNPVFPTAAGKQYQVFAIMPFMAQFDSVHAKAIKPACDSLGLSVGRGDNIFGSTQVINDVWSAIFNAENIIADCTSKNANVFYELGIAHTLGKKVVLITQIRDDIPFDVTHWRYVTYEASDQGLHALRENLEEFLRRDREAQSS